MFAEQIPLSEKILRTVIVYALIVVLFRLTGKRGLASMSTLDVVVIFCCPTWSRTLSSATTLRPGR
jgi:hypothetical protein